MNFKKNPIEKNIFFLRKKIFKKNIFFGWKIRPKKFRPKNVSTKKKFNQFFFDQIFFGDFFSKKKIIFFDRIFFKVHLKIQEIRFLRFPDRCGGPEKSYEPETKNIFWELFSIFWATFYHFLKRDAKIFKWKKCHEKKRFEKIIFFWQTDRIIYFSTHPGTLKTVHGNPPNFSSKTTCSQGFRIFRTGEVTTFKSGLTCTSIWWHPLEYVKIFQVFGKIPSTVYGGLVTKSVIGLP